MSRAVMMTLAYLTLMGCSQQPPAPPDPPAPYVACPDGQATPAPPPTPRTLPDIISWTGRLVTANANNLRALTECKRQLRAVQDRARGKDTP